MFYKISDCNTSKYKYAYKDMTFRGFERKICDKCNRNVVTMLYDNGVHHLILEGGSRYPDLLGFCGVGESMVILSEKALSIFKKHCISGISDSEQVSVVEQHHGQLLPPKGDVPDYFLLHISGKIELNFTAMALKKKKKCDCCGQFTWNRNRFHPLILDSKEWNGEDICRVTSIPGYVVCTDTVAQLIEKYSLTGFALSLL